MSGCNSSNYTYNFSPQKFTTDEVRWTGVSVPCLSVCSGSSVTVLEAAILEKLCELVNSTDLSGIVLPECLRIAFGTKDKTILEFVKFLLDESCNLQSQINVISGGYITLETPITLNYPQGCCNNGCFPEVTLTIGKQFEKIIVCLCNQQTTILDLQSQINTIKATVNCIIDNAQAGTGLECTKF